MHDNRSIFGLLWLCRRLSLNPKVYYYSINQSKSRTRELGKKHILERIEALYHKFHGVYGYRKLRKYLADKGILISHVTMHKYMKELGLKSLQRRKKHQITNYKPHKVFPNILKQNFNVTEKNKVWCTDFTYVPLSSGNNRYNCTIIDLYDRSVIASVNSAHIDAELAIKTLEEAIRKNRIKKGQVIIHSDQGSQFTSKAFVNFCKKHGIIQSMSRKGTPTDNAPMERYFNTLKHEYLDFYKFKSEKALFNAINNFAYVTYNHQRKHASLNYLTPFQKRYAS